jgi:hypothetical protein
MSIEFEPVGAQALWDKTFQKLNRSAPVQRSDESSANYMRRLSRIGKRYIPANEDIARVKFSELPDDVVPKFSEIMRNAVERNIFRTDNMAPGEMRPVLVTDPNTGAQQRHWVGPQSFVRDPAYGHRDCRRVLRFNAPASTTLYAASDAKRGMAGAW